MQGCTNIECHTTLPMRQHVLAKERIGIELAMIDYTLRRICGVPSALLDSMTHDASNILRAGLPMTYS